MKCFEIKQILKMYGIPSCMIVHQLAYEKDLKEDLPDYFFFSINKKIWRDIYERIAHASSNVAIFFSVSERSNAKCLIHECDATKTSKMQIRRYLWSRYY